MSAPTLSERAWQFHLKVFFTVHNGLALLALVPVIYSAAFWTKADRRWMFLASAIYVTCGNIAHYCGAHIQTVQHMKQCVEL